MSSNYNRCGIILPNKLLEEEWKHIDDTIYQINFGNCWSLTCPEGRAVLAVDAHGMSVRAIITAGTVADCKQAIGLIEGFLAENLLADKGYDSNAILEQAILQGMIPVIPPKKNRVDQREYDKEMYKWRHLVENAFLHLKRWRGIATRYAKNTASFLAVVQIRCIDMWGKII